MNVEVYEQQRLLDRGRIEAATADGQILWLAGDGADTRRLWELVPGRHITIL